MNDYINLVSKIHHCQVKIKKEGLGDIFRLNFQSEGYFMDIETL